MSDACGMAGFLNYSENYGVYNYSNVSSLERRNILADKSTAFSLRRKLLTVLLSAIWIGCLAFDNEAVANDRLVQVGKNCFPHPHEDRYDACNLGSFDIERDDIARDDIARDDIARDDIARDDIARVPPDDIIGRAGMQVKAWRYSSYDFERFSHDWLQHGFRCSEGACTRELDGRVTVYRLLDLGGVPPELGVRD